MRLEKTYIVVILALAVLAIAGFFGVFYPYHLFHREQFGLFLMNGETVMRYFEGRAWLANMVGDYLTQWYYYIGGGPLILALAIGGMGIMSYCLLRRAGLGRWMALAVGLLMMIWETGRECVGEYPLSSTMSVVMGLGMAWLYPSWMKSRGVRTICGVLIMLLAIWMTGNGGLWTGLYFVIRELMTDREQKGISWGNVALYAGLTVVALAFGVKTIWIGWPNMELEAQFKADTEWYWGRRDIDVDESIADTKLGEYYELLSSVGKASSGATTTSAEMKDYWKEHRYGQTLFMPVDPTGNYCTITAAGEVWFEMGDMTMAEHATMLGMIFSPKNVGSRHLRRLAEINIINGDEAAAEKYLYMLEQASVHGKWAKMRRVENRSETYKKWVENKRRMMAKSDVLRATEEFGRSMRNLLDANMDNEMAREYLLALDMQKKDMESFAKDYAKYGRGKKTRAIEEAIVVAMTIAPAEIKSLLMETEVSMEVIKDFNEFNRLFGQKNAKELKARFGNSYWFYCQFEEVR